MLGKKLNKNFRVVRRPGQRVWLHVSKPVWIVFYPFMEFFQVYRAIEHVPEGRNPWTIDNRVIGPKEGFTSLAAAMRAACKATVSKPQASGPKARRTK